MKREFLSKFGILILLLVNMSLISFSQVASGFVGEYDRTVILGKEGIKTITLGNPQNSTLTEENYYKWRIVVHPQDDEGTLSSDDAYNPGLTVTACGEYVIECVRVSHYGYQTEYCIIRVADNIEIASIECLRECFLKNGHIDISDFNIVTDPPGYETAVELIPGDDVASITGGSLGIDNYRYAHFRVKTDEGYYTPQNSKCFIKVVDDGVTHGFGGDHEVGTSVGSTILKLRAVLRDVKGALEDSPLGISPILYLDYRMKGGMSADCCDGLYAPVVLESSTISAGGGIDYTVPWPLPPVVTIHCKLIFEGSLKLTEFPEPQIETKPICREPLDDPVYIGTVTVSAELVVGAPKGLPFSASGGIRGSVSLEYQISKPFDALVRANLAYIVNVTCITTIFQVDGVIIEGKWYPWH